MNPQRPVWKRIAISLVLLLACCVVEAMAATQTETRHTFKPAATAPRPAAAPAAKGTVAAPLSAAPQPVPAAPLPAASAAYSFFTLPPCRVFDSRNITPPPLVSGVERTIQITGSCGVPADARAVIVNVTVTDPSDAGFLQIYPADAPARPDTSAINFSAGQTRSSNTIVALGSLGDVKAFLYTVPAAESLDLIVDVSGYLKPGAPMANDDPSVGDTSYVTTLNTDLNLAAPGVLSNDIPNGAAIVSYGATTGAEQTTIGTATPTSAGGSVILNADGSFDFTPLTGFKGDDTFLYVLQNTVGSSTATVTVSVGKGNQTITFTSTAPSPAQVGGTYIVTATASPSGLPVTLSIDATATSICSISGSTSGSTVTFNAVGTCVIDANQAGDVDYNPAPQVQQSVNVDKGDQTITFTSTPPVGAQVGGPTYTVTATASPSGLPVSFTIDASATAVCSISGSTVSFLTPGTCVIDANQAGDANYNAAPQVQQSDPVGKGDQTITFTSTPPAGATVGGPTYTVTATASSGLPVSFTIDASATSVCSISGSTVSFLAAGTCVIDANQAGDANYNPAPQAQQSDPVGKSDQTITFSSTPPAGAKVGGPTYTVTATASSGLTVAFTIDATATTVCSISGSTVSFIGAGTCVIDANQAGDANYNAAPQAQQSDPVGKGDQTITFTSTPPAGAKVGGPTYTVTATATSGLPVTFTIDATATSVCSISGSTVSFLAVGTCVIDANQAGNANYNAAPQAQQSDPVGKGDQTITFTSTPPAGAKVGGPTYTVTATASSGLPVTFTIDASATSVCSISGSTVSFIGAGTCVIDANQAGNANYNAAPQAQQSDPVGKGDQTITFTSTPPAGAKVGGPTYTVTATATSGLPVTFTIDATATSVCSISGSTVSFIGAGTCVIDANQAGNANYNAAPQAQQSDPVGKGDQTITFTSTPPA
ncbi:MAG TPA: Ig-like domain-containing protein, partial [Thermoanaerobaculia bacterium]|nr:Ig-like domain-containing protein [Thermoanaerobaculia bacterium]